ncbi:transcriptional regulator, LacI family [Methylobacterium nodulans ORS 2060]|uniref:Transcriptional regulator, LacI family n=1 Tax=Methylobacterium nodulans (strain LMG 21967 / CNCM I-2342 / ORS 2060) TaxID=460265 RepID=B8IDV8_METNO|nr:transcriptional regulator, LacI family [Methylobacterium nodulans ORS 2060]
MERVGRLGEDKQQARPTLQDIAQATGLSRATVSLVLRNNPSIPERTRRRVLSAAEQLGYVYNRGAASLRSTQTRLVGLAINDLVNPYFAEVTAAIEDALTAQNRIVILSNTGESVERQSAFAATIREYNVDGLLVVPARGTDAAFADLLRSWRLPFVMVSRSVPGAETDLVQADHRAGMVSATEHLISLGHRRIGFIGLNTDISTGRERLEGYQQALARSGIEFEPQLVRSGPASRDAGMSQVFALLDLPDPPTATVCFNDVVAFGAMLGLRARSLTPGLDFSVVGFDDVAEATLWRPALTSVSVPSKLIGQTAAELLVRRIDDLDAPVSVVHLPTELIIRDTTGRPAPRRRQARKA